MDRVSRPAVLCAALLCAAPRPAPAQQFEGVVTIVSWHLSVEGVTAQAGEDDEQDRVRAKLFALSPADLARLGAAADTQVMWLKRGIMRSAPMEVPMMGSAYMLMDLGAGLMRTVVPARQGYFEVSLRDAAPSPPDADEAEMQVEPLGRTQMISGMRCTGYRVTQGESVSQMWTTTDPTLRELMTAWAGAAGEEHGSATQGKAWLARYGAPVMSQELDDDGGFSVEIWSLERRALSDSLFALPAGFRKLDLPGR